MRGKGWRLVCAAVCCALLAGCGGGKDTAAGSKYTLPFRGTEVAVNAEAAPLLEKLGEPTDQKEAASCVFDGMDREYTYGGVIIRTYPAQGRDYVYTVELRDDSVSTGQGIAIGASREEVLAAYGAPDEETATALRYTDGDCTLRFRIEGDRVTGIVYGAEDIPGMD